MAVCERDGDTVYIPFILPHWGEGEGMWGLAGRLVVYDCLPAMNAAWPRGAHYP